MDLNNVNAVLTALTMGTQTLKVLKDTKDKIDRLEWETKTIELQETLNESRITIMSLQNEIMRLNNEARDLQAQLDRKNSLFFNEGACWSFEDKEFKDPYCAPCHEANNIQVHLTNHGGGYWQCPVCKVNRCDKTVSRSTVARIQSDYDPFS